ncbi:MAG TPA: hydrogenase maturation nickel metallochaperone HypA [Candidatus Sulfotelmatobacter sp.]|nr:hydrogenase maturation nickel metallochaperone HypA [Candidatus Sulfotelmatobacter sp.]
MHELSIAMSIVDAALDESQRRCVQVSAVHLRLGALSGVVKDALLFSYEMACQDTPLQGSRLIVEDIPVVVYCPRCQESRILVSVQSFACPECNQPTMDIRQGKELEVFALEVQEQDAQEQDVQAEDAPEAAVHEEEVKE